MGQKVIKITCQVQKFMLMRVNYVLCIRFVIITDRYSTLLFERHWCHDIQMMWIWIQMDHKVIITYFLASKHSVKWLIPRSVLLVLMFLVSMLLVSTFLVLIFQLTVFDGYNHLCKGWTVWFLGNYIMCWIKNSLCWRQLS